MELIRYSFDVKMIYCHSDLHLRSGIFHTYIYEYRYNKDKTYFQPVPYTYGSSKWLGDSKWKEKGYHVLDQKFSWFG